MSVDRFVADAASRGAGLSTSVFEDFDSEARDVERAHRSRRSSSAWARRSAARGALTDDARAEGRRGRKKKSLSEIFRPPTDIMHSGTFSQALTEARKRNRWLLVNVLDPKEFDSHRMNRDVWSNELIKETVTEGALVLWQVRVCRSRARAHALPTPPRL